MKQLTESLFAIVVPEDAKNAYISGFNWLCYSDGMHNIPEVWLGEELFEILGTVSQDTITFDVYKDEHLTEYFKENYFPYGFTKDNEECLRSLLTSKGINLKENTKLVIVKKI